MVAAYGAGLYSCPVTVENESDALKALADVEAAGCNTLVVYLGNFGPETPETILAQRFRGPVMYVAAAEGDGDLINGRGDAYCGMLNCSYNLGLRRVQAYIPDYPVGTARECAEMIRQFLPVARAILGVQSLKIITFGPRPQDFFACNAPIQGLYQLGVEVEENSELDLLVSYKAHAGDSRIGAVCADMAEELGIEGNRYPELLPRMAQFELTLLDWAETHKGARDYVAFADKCWPAFPEQFGFEPCYVNSRLASRGIPFHCGNTPACKMCDGRAVKYQLIQNRLLEDGGTPDFTRGTLEGDIAPSPITFYRLQCDAQGRLRGYIAQGEVLPVATGSFGGIGIFAIHDMGRFYRHVLLAKRYPHHGAVAFSHCGREMYEVFRYLGVTDIAYNQPASLPYPGENPFTR